MRSFRTATAALAAVLTGLAGLVAAPATATASAPPPTATHATGWYLALGDSLAAGYQPTTGDDPTGGYVGRVLATVRNPDNKLQLRNLACSGETVATMADGGRCSYEAGSQLGEALEFLHAHVRSTELVTVTIGANDVQRCVSRSSGSSAMSIDLACVAAGLSTVATRLPTILAALRQAAPDAQIVVTNYYNPFLAVWAADPQLAQFSTVLQSRLNTAIGAAAASADATVADVAETFRSYDWTPFDSTGLPTNVALVCRWTWMCTRTDIHANDDGYAQIANAVVARVDVPALAG